VNYLRGNNTVNVRDKSKKNDNPNDINNTKALRDIPTIPPSVSREGSGLTGDPSPYPPINPSNSSNPLTPSTPDSKITITAKLVHKNEYRNMIYLTEDNIRPKKTSTIQTRPQKLQIPGIIEYKPYYISYREISENTLNIQNIPSNMSYNVLQYTPLENGPPGSFHIKEDPAPNSFIPGLFRSMCL
jgi:hypothetical protein